LKRPNPLGLKYDTITSPRRLVNTFIHQMIPDLLKRDKPIKVVSGTIIRGTLKTPNSQLVTPISIKMQRPDGCD
jgi:hypothetical protein